MKKTLPFIALAAFLAVFAILLLSSSDRDDYYYSCAVPIFMKRADLEKSVQWDKNRPMENPGKIYYKDNYIYVSEQYKGVHVINNNNPRNPFSEAFISAPGCMDMAIKDQVLYVDNSVDLVAFDLLLRKETHREKNVLPEPAAPQNCYFGTALNKRTEDMILVEWRKKEK